MVGYSVFVTVINNTTETLENGRNTATYGKWRSFPCTIGANTTVDFELQERWGFGSEGSFSYDVYDDQRYQTSTISFSQTDGYKQDNAVSFLFPPKPEALYCCYYRSRTGNGPWQDNCADPKGHPVYVEYTIGYERKERYKFQLMAISAHSTHPVRNTHGHVILGSHTLWDTSASNVPSKFSDKDVGSFQPNVVGYKIGSKLSDVGSLSVTIQSRHSELTGSEALLIGHFNGRKVWESEYFYFKEPLVNISLIARVVDPSSSNVPLLLNGDVSWMVKLRRSNEDLEHYGDWVTRLELYWIAAERHIAFSNHIPIEFLRSVLEPLSDFSGTNRSSRSNFCADVTTHIFHNFNKRYDTATGASHFNVNQFGGNFALNRYLHRDPRSDVVGAAFPVVNCFDQAAMVELSCSLLRRTGWLALQPFGYINATQLVGIKDARGNLISVNNPFFRNTNPPSPPRIDNPYDDRRTGFGLHVFNCHTYDGRQNDVIYDACGGPHVGTETIHEYLRNAIDHNPSLYQNKPNRASYIARPGTNPVLGTGVGLAVGKQRARLMFATPELLYRDATHDIQSLTTSVVTCLGWADLDTWLKPTLGDEWDVVFDDIIVGDMATQAFWRIADANIPDDPIDVKIDMFSVVGEDGYLDLSVSAAAAAEHANSLPMTTQLNDVWMSGTLPGIGSYFQYRDHIASGRIVVVVRNLVIDIAGMMSTKELHPVALKLISRGYTQGRDVPGSPFYSPVAIPVPRLQLHVVNGGTLNDASTITVTGVHTHFSIVFSVNVDIISASAHCNGGGVVLARYIVGDEDSDDEGDGERRIGFFFITAEDGCHPLRLSVADSETMFVASAEFEVEVL